MVEVKQPRGKQEEDATEQCVLLQTEQIAGEKHKTAKIVGEQRDGNGRREEKRFRWLEHHNFPRDGALV